MPAALQAEPNSNRATRKRNRFIVMRFAIQCFAMSGVCWFGQRVVSERQQSFPPVEIEVSLTQKIKRRMMNKNVGADLWAATANWRVLLSPSGGRLPHSVSALRTRFFMTRSIQIG